MTWYHEFLGFWALSANLIYGPSGSYKMRDAFVTLTEHLCLLSPYLSTRRDCHGTWLTWDRRWNGTRNYKVLGHWGEISHSLSYIHIAPNYNCILFPAKKLFFFFFFFFTKKCQFFKHTADQSISESFFIINSYCRTSIVVVYGGIMKSIAIICLKHAIGWILEPGWSLFIWYYFFFFE